jgi:hypothetical protein
MEYVCDSLGKALTQQLSKRSLGHATS